MLRRRPSSGEKAQIFLEYTIVIGVIILAMFAMSKMLQRGTQGMIKVVSDQVGIQENSEQTFDEGGGFLESAYTSTRSNIDKTKQEFLGSTSYIFGDSTLTESNALINLGFTNEE